MPLDPQAKAMEGKGTDAARMRIVGSCTTLPKRLGQLPEILDSWLGQTRPFDHIYVNIPFSTMQGEKYILPDAVIEFFVQHRHNISVHRDVDYGPLTKLLPTLVRECQPDTVIVTFDDDQVAHPDTLLVLARKHVLYPNACLSFSGWNIGRVPFFFESVLHHTEDECVDWLSGCHTILYPRSVFPTDVSTLWQDSIPAIQRPLLRNDDHRVAIYLARRHVSRIAINEPPSQYFRKTKNSNLSAINGGTSFAAYFRWRKYENYVEILKIGWFAASQGWYTHNGNPLDSCLFWLSMAMIGSFLWVLVLLQRYRVR